MKIFGENSIDDVFFQTERQATIQSLNIPVQIYLSLNWNLQIFLEMREDRERWRLSSTWKLVKQEPRMHHTPISRSRSTGDPPETSVVFQLKEKNLTSKEDLLDDSLWRNLWHTAGNFPESWTVPLQRAGRPSTSDWYINSFIMDAYESFLKISQNFPYQVQPKKFS